MQKGTNCHFSRRNKRFVSCFFTLCLIIYSWYLFSLSLSLAVSVLTNHCKPNHTQTKENASDIENATGIDNGRVHNASSEVKINDITVLNGNQIGAQNMTEDIKTPLKSCVNTALMVLIVCFCGLTGFLLYILYIKCIFFMKPGLLERFDNHKMTRIIFNDERDLCECFNANTGINAQQPCCDVVKLIQDTWLYTERLGRDSVKLKHSGIKVRIIYRIYNKKLWNAYARRKAALVQSIRQPQELIDKPILTTEVIESENVNTKDGLPKDMDVESKSAQHSTIVVIPEKGDNSKVHKANSTLEERNKLIIDGRRLDKLSQEEAYLFHGTVSDNVIKIIENGFNLSKARRGLYGTAIYLAESSEKSDQYADFPKCRKKKHLAMFIVRTFLGRTKCNETGRRMSSPSACNEFDSAVADIGFREFLIFDSTQCYPEFLVIYDRI